MRQGYWIGVVLCLSALGTVYVLLNYDWSTSDRSARHPHVQEHITDEEKAVAAKLKPGSDRVLDEIHVFTAEVARAFERRDFDALEKQAAEARRSKAVFANGSWRSARFYAALGCSGPDAKWKAHDDIHRAWMAAKPQSVTARIAYADFLESYSWKARGGGYADTVSKEGWRIFFERLDGARKALDEARALPEKDPVWWRVALSLGRAQQWEMPEINKVLEEGKRFEPKFWGYDTDYAFTLMPRWYGKPGDWEKYAEASAARPDGLGIEVYARIVLYLRHRYDNIFRESHASWPKAREGLEVLRKKYPESLELVSETAMLAATAEDRPLAKAMFDRLGDTYIPQVWGGADRFVHVRHWAETGEW